MATPPTELTLTVSPSARYDLIDMTKRVRRECGEALDRYRKALYCSHHTTAGYLDHSLASRLRHESHHLSHFFGAFRALFPPGAEYQHDQMDLRSELSDEQKGVEPRNADSHLTFIGAGMRNCVTYRNDPETPVYFIELDGVNEGTRRVRSTSILAYDQEEFVHRATIPVPVSRHPVDSINLADPRVGFLDEVNELLARYGIEKGRVDITLAPQERHAGVTVNEYETLLMQHDLPEVLKNPLKYAALRGRHMLDDPLAIPGKTINYAKYDFVQVVNSLMEAFRFNESVVEKLLARIMEIPARRFLGMKRSVSFLASDGNMGGPARIVRGRYQSPILVQWRAADRQVRALAVTLVRFR
ncbi:MAG TPA: hypothetical protein VJU18_18730 [Vicinamibacteria bacterium]|nr:hypothetical protein [Vicinamibacteria bacterium]